MSTPIKLKYVAQLNPTRRQKYKPRDKVSFVPMEAVGEDGSLDIQERSLSEVSSGYTYFENNDVVLAKITPCFENGKATLMRNLKSGFGFGTTEFIVLRPGKDVNSKYLYYTVYSDSFRTPGINEMRGSAGQKRITNQYVGDYEVSVTDVEEQQKIVKYLDSKTQALDKILTAKNHTHTHLSELRQAIITSAVLGTGGAAMNLQHTNIPWIGKIPAHWEVIKLKHILRAPVTDGPHETPIFYDTGVPFLSVDGIKDGELDLEDVRYVSEEDYLKFIQKAKPEKGDILLGKAASTGKIARVKTDTKFCIWSPLALLKIREDIDPEFIEYVLKSGYVQHNVDLLSTFNTQKNISMRDIPNIAIALPPKKEREEIVVKIRDSLQKIDSAEKQLQKSISQLEEYRSSLISNVVGGKVEV